MTKSKGLNMQQIHYKTAMDLLITVSVLPRDTTQNADSMSSVRL